MLPYFLYRKIPAIRAGSKETQQIYLFLKGKYLLQCKFQSHKLVQEEFEKIKNYVWDTPSKTAKNM